MKPLTPLEIEFWKINNIIEWNDRLLQSQSWEQEIQKARASAALCERKMEELKIEIGVQKAKRSVAEHAIEHFQKILLNESQEIPKHQDFASRHGDAEGYARGCGQLVLLERIKKQMKW